VFDLIVISKFGKQEAARAGLADAFRAPSLGQTPILTAVAPAGANAWTALAVLLAEYLPLRRDAIGD
jgi:hypothetical protein